MSNAAVAALFVRLRWKMLRGALRSGGAQALVAGVGIVASVVVGIVGGIVAFTLGRDTTDPEALYVTAITAAVLVVMMIGVIAGISQPVDPRVLATEPLTERQLGIGLLAASAAGPPGLSAALLGIGLFAGAVSDAASVVPLTAATLGVLATLLLLSRTTVNVLGLLSIRHPRVGQVIVGLSTLVFYAAFQLVPRVAIDLDDDERTQIVSTLSWTPTGQLGQAFAATTPLASLAHTVVGALWLLPLLLAFTWTTRRLVTSVRGGAARRLGPAARRHRVRTLVRAACGRGGVGATAWRGVLTRFRTPRTALETVTASGVGLAIVLVPVLTGGGAGAGAVLAGGAIQFAVLFMAGNSFGSDGPAMANELLTGADPGVLVSAKARSVLVAAAPLAVVGPMIAAVITGQWTHLPAGMLIGVGALFAGTGAAMVQSALIPIAIPESDNPLAGGDSGKGWFAGLVFFAVLAVLGLLTLPVALGLLWAISIESAVLVTLFACVSLAAGAVVMRVGVSATATRWRDRTPELYAAVVPTR
jgi:hypothetical protein